MALSRRERFRRWLCKQFGHKPGRWEYSCGGRRAKFCKRCDVLVENYAPEANK